MNQQYCSFRSAVCFSFLVLIYLHSGGPHHGLTQGLKHTRSWRHRKHATVADTTAHLSAGTNETSINDRAANEFTDAFDLSDELLNAIASLEQLNDTGSAVPINSSSSGAAHTVVMEWKHPESPSHSDVDTPLLADIDMLSAMLGDVICGEDQKVHSVSRLLSAQHRPVSRSQHFMHLSVLIHNLFHHTASVVIAHKNNDGDDYNNNCDDGEVDDDGDTNGLC